jgi:murein DD-endopeptidase MepM/ murein hydrolase activator NlpD
VHVPGVVGRTVARARALARRAQCRLGRLARRHSAEPRGRVIRQVPRPGARLRSQASFRVTVSKGRKRLTCKDLTWPARGRLESPFGWRWGRMHEGIDIGAPYGSAIRAAAAGTVVEAGWEGDYGNLVVVDHGWGLSIAYAHQSRIAVSYGRNVAARQILG